VLPSAGCATASPVAVELVDGVDVGELPPDGDPDADEVVVAGAEEDVLVAGGDCGGVEDFRALVVGLAARVALGVSDAVPRLVPVA
jgi:hypothetical protein